MLSPKKKQKHHQKLQKVAVHPMFSPSDAAAMPAVKPKDSGARRRMAPPAINDVTRNGWGW